MIIDAVLDPLKEVGIVTASTLEEFSGSSHLVTAHQIDLPTAALIGEKIGQELPKEIFVVAIVASDVTTFCEKCTDKVEAAIEPAAGLAIEIARRGAACPNL